jgi:signal transduction histidine kinase
VTTNHVVADVGNGVIPARLSRVGRVERVIAAARVVLAAFSFAAIWLDPSTPARFAEETYALLGVYLIYTLVALGVVSTARFVSLRWTLFTHVLDLTAFSVVMYLTEGPTSPFFVYFIFAVLAATLRWQWRGTLWTALASIVMYLSMGAYVSIVLEDPTFELNRFMIRSVYLAVAAFLLGYAGYYRELVEGELARVAAWPRDVSDEIKALVAEMLPEASSILRAPHLVMVWEELEEPWLYIASWRDGRLETERQPPGVFEEIVAEPLRNRSFMCPDLADEPNTVLVASAGGPSQWTGTALDPAAREKLGIRTVLTWPLRGETFNGRLFAAQKPDMIVDDLVLGEIVATLVSSRIDHAYLMKRLRYAAAVEERYHLGRDLHDGVLQSLTAVALQVRAVADLVPERADAARQQLQELQAVLESEQRDLRIFIGELRPPGGVAPSREFVLGPRLAELCARIERVWPIRVTLRTSGEFTGDASLALNLYRVIHEALTNAARHSGASTVEVVLACSGTSVIACISDNGRGFPFLGTRGLSELVSLRQGPVTLRERVARLDGDLVIHSTVRGSRLDISIPVPAPHAERRSATT